MSDLKPLVMNVRKVVWFKLCSTKQQMLSNNIVNSHVNIKRLENALIQNTGKRSRKTKHPLFNFVQSRSINQTFYDRIVVRPVEQRWEN